MRKPAGQPPFFAFAPVLPRIDCAAELLRRLDLPSFAAAAFAFCAASLPLP